MRNELAKQLEQQFNFSPFVFLTGDLGYLAFESLQNKMGKYFINAGIAEQNMISMAAGIVSEGISCWAYSIAPFIYARPFEQIRNDISFQSLPVKLVGNGGGFAYGVMGSTHHALEDYGILLTLAGMKAYVPCFETDLEAVVSKIATECSPTYLRLGYDEAPKDFYRPDYAPWRKILVGDGGLIVAVGSIAGSLLSVANEMDIKTRPEIWVVSELPLVEASIPSEFWESFGPERSLLIVEEHVEQGSFARMFATEILRSGKLIRGFDCINISNPIQGLSGSQQFLRKQNNLDAFSVLAASSKLQSN